jgi:twitching motility protein PilT
MTLPDLLRATLALGGSDLHLAVGSPPRVRVNGQLRQLDVPVLTPEETKALAYSVLSDAQQETFEKTWELDLAFELGGIGRFRCNVFNQRGAVGSVFRLIPERIRTLEELGLPAVVAGLAERSRGLVLVVGATGSGKSTTLAAMVDQINRSRAVHILTIEDPIEYLHPHQRALVNQRQVHSDTRRFSRALRAALREDPDVVLIGELRDLETMDAAMTLAETGHLTLATLHTSSAAQTVTRIVDAFPARRQTQVRTQLSLVLEGIVCQRLLPTADGAGRVAALEVLVATPGIRSLIRDDKVHQIYGAMQTGQDRFGMQTMSQALARLVGGGVVSREAAVGGAPNPDELLAMLDRDPARTPAVVGGMRE